MRKIILGLAAVVMTAQPVLAQQASLEDRVSELEANASLNIFEFNGNLETRFDSIKAEQTDPTASAIEEENLDFWRTKFSLGVNARVSDKIKFYSKMTASKFNNVTKVSSNGGGAAPTLNEDLNIAKDEKGAQIYVEKAYADVTVADTTSVFSFGRLPTSDGPPFNLPNGRARLGTYPGLIYNAQLDGIAYSYNHAIDQGSSLSARVVYTPFTSYSSNEGKVSGSGILQSPQIGGKNSNTTTNLTTAMIEYSNRDLGFAQNVNVILQGYQTGNIQINGSDVNTYISQASSWVTGNASSAVGSEVSANALHIDFEGIMDSKFDFAVTYLQSKIKNNGCITFTVGPQTFCGIYGYGAAEEGEEISDSSTLTALRYKALDTTYVGVEYLNGGKSAFVYDTNNDPLTGFYSTTGTASHIYVLHKFTSELGLRVGSMTQNYKNTPFNFGASSETDRKIATTYANLRLDF